MTSEKAQRNALAALAEWYSSLTVRKSSAGPARGSIAVALVVLEHLKESYSLELDAHTARGGSQIRGVTPNTLKNILARFGETRPFVKEGGRTNRGGRGDAGKLLNTLKDLGLEALSPDDRHRILDEFQRWLVEKVQEFHGRQRLEFGFDPSTTTYQLIESFLSVARAGGKEGPVAQHLVGAKLQLRFPDVPVPNQPFSAADEQSGRPGDFYIGDTVFHVTVAPSPALFEKCLNNLRRGYRVYVLVADRTLAAARQLAELNAPGRITCLSIESFVGPNVDEVSTFSRVSLRNEIRNLLDTYNTRVNAVELDKSLLIDVPRNLAE